MSDRGGLAIYKEDALHVRHEYVGGPYGGFVLLPLGLRLNRELADAKVGTALEFDGGERARLLNAKVVRTNDAITSGMAVVRYGLDIKDLRKVWCREAVYTGAGVGSVDKDSCLLLFYRRKEGM